MQRLCGLGARRMARPGWCSACVQAGCRRCPSGSGTRCSTGRRGLALMLGTGTQSRLADPGAPVGVSSMSGEALASCCLFCTRTSLRLSIKTLVWSFWDCLRSETGFQIARAADRWWMDGKELRIYVYKYQAPSGHGWK